MKGLEYLMIISFVLAADKPFKMPSKAFAPYINVEVKPPMDMAAVDSELGNKWFTLGFINSDGQGKPTWPGSHPINKGDPNPFFLDNIKSLRAKGGDVILAFGGLAGGANTAAGSELALNIQSLPTITDKLGTLTAAYRTVIDAYQAKHVDFDIEAMAIDNDQGSVDLRFKALNILRKEYPEMLFSFTIPCFPTGLAPNGIKLLKSSIDNNFKIDVVNIMTMDFGAERAPDGKASMGKYSISAAEGTRKILQDLGMEAKGTKIGITPMIGNNDVLGEVFTVANAQEVVDYAMKNDYVSILSFWALHRDNGAPITEVLSLSNQVTDKKFAYSSIFAKFKSNDPVPEDTNGNNNDNNNNNNNNNQPQAPSVWADFRFGSFDSFCKQSGLALCTLVGGGKEPLCYARDLETFMPIFQPATLGIHIIAFIMTVVMISNINVKYTAVGREEMVIFFYMYAMLTVLEFFVISGLIPKNLSIQPVFVAAHSALVTATLFCLFMNGFVPFQFMEDGSARSLWTLRLSTIVVFGICYFISIATFKNIIFSAMNPTLLWIVYLILGAFLGIGYFVTQLVVIFSQIDDRTPIFDIVLAGFFAVVSQICLFVFSTKACEYFEHYIDGLFFSTIFNLLSVMMIYKYWCGITKEDLEFAVGYKSESWDLKDPLLSNDAKY
ncbi:chitin synthase III catalytic subunit-domain-containing protein [Globomyces pollinis-pini]|nr:chitin synthase III catalytic subunit-domain-containing protein [Globomyces pollinis-pini]